MKSISSCGSSTVKSTPMAARWKVSAPSESEPVVSKHRPGPASVTTPEVRENSSATTCGGACTSTRAWYRYGADVTAVATNAAGSGGSLGTNLPPASPDSVILSTLNVRQSARSTSNAMRYQR